MIRAVQSHSTCVLRYCCPSDLFVRMRRPAAAAASAAKPAAASSNSFAALADQAEEDTPSSRPTSGELKKAQRKPLRDPLVWIDLEMTGLDTEQHTIIEVACIATDGELQIQIEGPAMAIHQPEEVLAGMNDWCKEHHGKSGLTQRVRESKVSMREAELALLEFVQKHAPGQGAAQLAGNSIHVDRMFLLKYMPELTAHLSYRLVDVSTIKELAKRWYPSASKKAPRKKNAHTALSDIKESIEELLYFRKTIFIGGGRGGR